MDENQAVKNTDVELWRERKDDYYADSIHVTERGGIGINCGGMVHVKPIREWHRLAVLAESAGQEACCQDYEHCNRACAPRGVWLEQTKPGQFLAGAGPAEGATTQNAAGQVIQEAEISSGSSSSLPAAPVPAAPSSRVSEPTPTDDGLPAGMELGTVYLFPFRGGSGTLYEFVSSVSYHELERALAAQRTALDAAEQALICDVCLGKPLPSGKSCVCKGTGNLIYTLQGTRENMASEWQAADAQRAALLALAERIRREGMQGVANEIEEIVKL